MTQLEINKCSEIESKEADAELNRVYRLVRKIYQKVERISVHVRTSITLQRVEFLKRWFRDKPLYYLSLAFIFFRQ